MPILKKYFILCYFAVYFILLYQLIPFKWIAPCEDTMTSQGQDTRNIPQPKQIVANNTGFADVKAKELLIDTPGCKIIHFNSHVGNMGSKPPRPAPCARPHFEIDNDGIIKLTEYGRKHFRVCCFRQLYRVERGYKVREECDWEVRSTNCTEIPVRGEKLSSPYVQVECQSNNATGDIFVDFAATVFPPEKHSVLTALKASYWSKRSHIPTRPPSVILIGIYGVSRLHMARSLPETRKFALKNEFIEFKGFTKTASKNYGNMMAMLQGSQHPRRQCSRNVYKEPLDNCPFIWKNFSNLHYITGLVEDSPSLSMFNYMKIGFCKQPFHYYPRTLMAAAHVHLKGKRTHGLPRNCFNGLDLSGTIFNYTHKFLQEIAEKSPYFLVTAFRTLQPGALGLMNEDTNFLGLLQNLISNPDYHGNNTFIILHSTHGPTFPFPKFRGFHEDNTPMFLIRIPPHIKKQYPRWVRNLEINAAKRLTTSADVYATLEHILSSVVSSSAQKSVFQNPLIQVQKPLYSLFEPIPLDRTCDSAKIPGQYCLCGSKEFLMPGTPFSSRLSHTLLHHINSILEPVLQPGLCVKHIMNTYNYGRIVNEGYGRSPLGLVVRFVDYRISLETYPSHGIFEGEIRHFQVNDSMNVIGSVKRISVAWADHSSCINDENLKPFCICQEVSVRKRISKLKELMKWSAYAPPLT